MREGEGDERCSPVADSQEKGIDLGSVVQRGEDRKKGKSRGNLESGIAQHSNALERPVLSSRAHVNRISQRSGLLCSPTAKEMSRSQFRTKSKRMSRTGIEPVPRAWKARMITTSPTTRWRSCQTYGIYSVM